ncbi:Hypothetical protein A7982_08558 [Minicystis rosea]|nr:Hypothetical protein A7982_08558 [Minicystis rosea]
MRPARIGVVAEAKRAGVSHPMTDAMIHAAICRYDAAGRCTI